MTGERVLTTGLLGRKLTVRVSLALGVNPKEPDSFGSSVLKDDRCLWTVFRRTEWP